MLIRMQKDLLLIQSFMKKMELNFLAQNSGLQRHIFSTDKLIKVPKDLANETFRTYEDAIVNEFYGGLGNIAIMPYGELYTSLQNGLITATDQQIPSYIIENYYEVAPFYSYVGAQWTSYSLMMNLDKFNQYSEEDQKDICGCCLGVFRG